MSRSGKIIAINDHYIYQLIGDPDYVINKNGTIQTRIAKTGKRFVDPNKWRTTGCTKPSGYNILRYRYKHLQLARIVYAMFKGQLEIDLVVYHKDYDITNNHVDNLIMGTMSELNKHFINNPKKKHNPIRHYKLSFEVAEQIREDYSRNLTYSKLMEKYDLAKSTISYIINQRTWKRSIHTPFKIYSY